MKKMNQRTSIFNYKESTKKTSKDFFSRNLGYVDNYLNRPIAGIIVKMVYNTRITPDQLTYFSFFVGLLSAFFFSLGEHLYFIIGGVLFQSSSIIDGADGMLARSRKETSRFGAYLDLMFDRILDFLVFVALTFGSAAYFNSQILLPLGLLGAGLYLLQINLFYLIKGFLESGETGETGEGRALMIFFVLVFSLFNRLDIAIYLLLASSLLSLVVKISNFIRLGRKQK